MMSRLLVALVLACGVVPAISAQDPTKTLPESYKIELDNDHLRVVRVHYDAGAKLPDHTHPAGTTVYLYLNDSEGVTFSHSGNINRTVTRPPVKAGAVRIASGPEEHHTAENTGSMPSDFLRIWLKTESSGERSLRRRLSPTDQEFENKQLRVTRLTVVDGKPMTIATPKGRPALLVAWPSGRLQWIEGNERVPLTTAGEFLRVDVLTDPK